MEPFWNTKTLEQMTREEWESLCDGCGRCCLHKLRDEETNALSFTNVACRLLDLDSCRCGDYARRRMRVPDCVSLTPQALKEIDWLPPSCAYRRLRDGEGLAWWHPLVSGDPDTVHQAGVSARGRAISERNAGALEDHVVDWPGMPAPGMPAPGMPAPGMPAPGMPAPGMPAPGMPAPTMPARGKPAQPKSRAARLFTRSATKPNPRNAT